MGNNGLELSRRKILAGLGTVGVASAGAGVGTSAFFSDTESFEDNQLTAGELDLKVDWEEHYSDWSEDEANAVSDIVMTANNSGNVPDGYVGLPDPAAPMIAVPESDVPAFQDATAIEAYPDTDGDGIQDPFGQTTNGTTVADICTDGADNPNDLDPANSLRSDNDDTVDSDGNAKPIVSLGDVKPGDFGEVTFSFHLCDNPGYVWLQGEQVSAGEGGVNEPEADSGGEDQYENETLKSGSGSPTVELLDAVQTTLWYDDGDNVLEQGGQQGANDVDVVIVIDESGSISSSEYSQIQSAAKDFVDLLDANDQSASVGFATTASLQQQLTTNKQDVKNAIDGSQSGGNTNMQAAINTAQDELESSRARSNADPFIVLLSDGAPTSRSSDPSDSPFDLSNNNVEAALEAADAAKSDDTRIVSLGFGLSSGSTGENVLRSVAGTTANSEQTYQDGTYDDEGDYIAAPSGSDLQNAFGQIGEIVVSGEEVFFRGTLREALNVLEQGNGIPLDGDRNTDYEEVDSGAPNSNGADSARECFTAEMSHYVGFAWYVPTSVGNEIQSDSVEFDLGFYTEQCRHNDGSGQTA